MLPKVSIIIPFYNDPYVDQAIVSALYQTYPNLEIIVVDDGSTRHQNMIAPYRSRIHYLGKRNGGTGSALNYGITMATGKYVAWLSSDDRFTPDKVERQVAYMEQTQARICHTDYHVINEHGTITEYTAAAKYASAKAFINGIRHGCPVNGCTIMMTKELFIGLGGFNEGLPYTHDYDMWIRVLLSRVDFHYLNEPLTLYRRHSQMGTVRNFNTVMHEANGVNAKYAHLLDQLLATLPG
ncbi:glycosyltransferase [Paenibacillus lignilyticus]|uniref:Glycosyltransferase n=1 Tax=Paenibacillus lignilyticus TaxID=1172615 RepID=A0ABS5C7M4_9BACL|nr:glycosyltransferase [Paenibacillus lignilyticus]MBP3961972.1 glycosyltransferase [Paenibacillus lignilyticus]